MPIIKSAKKRVRVAQRAAVRNYKTKQSLKKSVKAFRKSVSSGTKVAQAHAAAQSAIGKAAKKHVIHKNKAARQQRQLAAKAKAMAVSKKTSSKTAKKPAKTTVTKAKNASRKKA